MRLLLNFGHNARFDSQVDWLISARIQPAMLDSAAGVPSTDYADIQSHLQATAHY